MDVQEIVTMVTQAISTLGFPIIACVALFKQNETYEQRHENETKLFSDAINNNTKAIETLTALITGGKI